jgi:hypothetical protein
MAAMANIVVKKADNTTDVTYTAATPSAGDSVPAIWRQNAASTIMGHRPKLSLLIRDNAAKTGRVFQGAVTFPHTWTDTASGKVSLLATTPIRFEGTLPAGVPVPELKEAIYQAGNLFVSALIRAALEEQYAPT